MISLALAVCCSLALGMILKYTGIHRIDRLGTITINYVAALCWSVGLQLLHEGTFFPETPHEGFIGLGMLNGLLFISAFFLMAWGTDVAGLGLTYGVWRLSVVIPFLASWLIWNEVPGPYKIGGMVAAGAAFFMISHGGTQGRGNGNAGYGKVLLALGLLFLVGGVVDTIMKAYRQMYADTYGRPAFQILIFGTALLIGASLLIRRGLVEKTWFDGRAVLWGVLLGTANYWASEFFLRAVASLPGPFVFPANSIAIVLGSAALGVAVWRERLSLLNIAGLAISVLALFLLNH